MLTAQLSNVLFSFPSTIFLLLWGSICISCSLYLFTFITFLVWSIFLRILINFWNLLYCQMLPSKCLLTSIGKNYSLDLLLSCHPKISFHWAKWWNWFGLYLIFTHIQKEHIKKRCMEIQLSKFNFLNVFILLSHLIDNFQGLEF